MSAAANPSHSHKPLILALPNGRILGEVMPLLRRLGITPEPAFEDPGSRQLRFATSEPALDLIRVRSFDVATFVAFGSAQLGIAGNDVLMEFDYSEIYAPLDLDVGHCRIAVAATADWVAREDFGRTSHIRVATKYPEITRRIAEEGHEVAHHSYFHENTIGMDEKTEADMIDLGLRALHDVAGVRPRGCWSRRAMRWIASLHSSERTEIIADAP